MRVTRPAPATAATQIRCSRAKSETCLAYGSSSSEFDPCSMSQRTRPSGPFDLRVNSSRRALGTAVNPSYPRPWANRITRWRANLGSLGKIGHRSETGARVIGEQRARGSPLCRSQFVQSPVDCLGNRSVCSRRSLLRRSLPRRSTTRVHGLGPGTSSRMDTSMSAKSTTAIDSSGNSSQPSWSSPDEENTTAPPTRAATASGSSGRCDPAGDHRARSR